MSGSTPLWRTPIAQQPTVAVLQPLVTTATGATVPGTGAEPAVASFYWGTGAPTFSAPNGSVYLRYDGTPGTDTFYVNTSGPSSSGVTWTAKF